MNFCGGGFAQPNYGWARSCSATPEKFLSGLKEKTMQTINTQGIQTFEPSLILHVTEEQLAKHREEAPLPINIIVQLVEDCIIREIPLNDVSDPIWKCQRCEELELVANMTTTQEDGKWIIVNETCFRREDV
jgi:hypothetical protein